MKTLFKLCAVSAILAFSSNAYAETDATPKNMTGMNCPMMGDMSAMQNNMGAMMTDMSSMMKSTGSPPVKARMQQMYDQMATMKARMMKMSGGMMGGGQMMDNTPPATTPAPSDDHTAHHPNQ